MTIMDLFKLARFCEKNGFADWTITTDIVMGPDMKVFTIVKGEPTSFVKDGLAYKPVYEKTYQVVLTDKHVRVFDPENADVYPRLGTVCSKYSVLLKPEPVLEGSLED